MKKIKKAPFFTLVLFAVTALGIYNFLKPVVAFGQIPAYRGNSKFICKTPPYDPIKKTVYIIADNRLTELFDMLAPFYVFNASEKLNVYIVAKNRSPILVKKDLFVLPQLTFREADSLKLKADVIVIPALSVRDENQDTVLVHWIQSHCTPTTKMLAVCDGASTAAATELYNGIPLTCHSSDYAGVKAHFKKAGWVQGVSVTHSGNLFSTAGVSNAVEGSLLVLNDLLGREVMLKSSKSINYPYKEIKLTHQNNIIKFSDKLTVAKKMVFHANSNPGLLLENGIDEFTLAGVLDTYSRTFPASVKIFTLQDSVFQTKYGLTLVHTGGNKLSGLNEIHILSPGDLSAAEATYFKDIAMVKYNPQKEYLIDRCLQRIAAQYGEKFRNVVKLMLDYN